MAVALEQAESSAYYHQLRAEYEERRDSLDSALRSAGLKTLAVEGAYFLMAAVAGLGFPDDVAFCRWLTTEIGVAALPPSSFYLDAASAPLLARFCFAKKPETIALAAERLSLLSDRLARR
jgi:aspartate/methionine/tyrosine aminotransferase